MQVINIKICESVQFQWLSAIPDTTQLLLIAVPDITPLWLSAVPDITQLDRDNAQFDAAL